MHKGEAETKIEDKVAAFWSGEQQIKPKHFYDTYDYASFWKGRDYENQSDQMAVRRLMKRVPLPHREIVDIGGGIGRMAPLYEELWNHVVILDPSSTQLAVAKKNVSRPDKIEFIEGSVEAIPLPPASCDTALCIRTFHYIEDPRRAIREMGRILVHGGNLILEIPNKIHMKARIKSLFSRNSSSREAISQLTQNQDFPFLNHHPAAIRDTLLAERFEIVETLSVSNFRSRLLKKIIPLSMLLFFEKISQHTLAKMWFGPSIYFLARKR